MAKLWRWVVLLYFGWNSLQWRLLRCSHLLLFNVCCGLLPRHKLDCLAYVFFVYIMTRPSETTFLLNELQIWEILVIPSGDSGRFWQIYSVSQVLLLLLLSFFSSFVRAVVNFLSDNYIARYQHFESLRTINSLQLSNLM